MGKGVGGGGGFWGGIHKFSSLKGGPSQKLKAEEVFYRFDGALKRKWKGGHAKFFRDNQKTTIPPYP